jgi:hypothetical protein
MALQLIQGKQISVNLTGSFTGSFSGSLFGTASFAISSSNSISSSFATNSTSASFAVSSSRAVSASFATTASIVQSIANNITNNVNNNVLTATGGSTINGEANLTFDEGLLNINGQLQQGEGVRATGNYSHAEGGSTNATGNYSHAEGKRTEAIGDHSHAEGERTKTGTETGYLTDDSNPIVGGLITLDNGYGNVLANFTTGGYLYISDEDFDNSIGRNVYVIDTVFISLIAGSSTEIQLIDTSVNTTQAIVGDLTTLLNSGDFGGDQLIPGPYSHTEGNLTYAIGQHSHAEGESTNAIGNASHAEGGSTQAIAYGSHAEGFGTQAIGEYSHAEGRITEATGASSHAEGYLTTATGDYSHAEGYETIALGTYQHVQGQYNISSTVQSAFIHGNGEDENSRSNLIYAHDSIVEITGSLKVSGSITGSLFGTSSWANSAVSSSFSATASYSQQAVSSSFAQTASFAPSYLPLTGGTISGNLTVIGTASFAYTTASIVSVGTNVIIVSTDLPASRFGGISVIDSGSFGNMSTGSLFWDSLNNRWVYSNPSGSNYDGGLLISGPRNTSGLGNEVGMDSNFVAVGQGADHIRPGSIYNSGSITIVTGSLNVTAGITGSLFGTASHAQTASIAPNYLPIASPQVTGLEISFTTDRMYGSYALPETGSAITSNTSSAIPGATNIIIHSASAVPTIGSDFKKLTGSSDYVAGLNYIYCTYIADNQIIYSVNQAT